MCLFLWYHLPVAVIGQLLSLLSYRRERMFCGCYSTFRPVIPVLFSLSPARVGSLLPASRAYSLRAVPSVRLPPEALAFLPHEAPSISPQRTFHAFVLLHLTRAFAAKKAINRGPWFACVSLGFWKRHVFFVARAYKPLQGEELPWHRREQELQLQPWILH